MRKNQAQRIEDLSEQVGGRFRLSTLIIKRMREYYTAGGAFMPRVSNQSELLDMVLDQIERKEIGLKTPQESAAAIDEEKETGGEEDSETGLTPEEVLGDKS